MDNFFLLTNSPSFWVLLLVAVIFFSALFNRLCECIERTASNKKIADCFGKFLNRGGKTDGNTSVSSSEKGSK